MLGRVYSTALNTLTNLTHFQASSINMSAKDKVLVYEKYSGRKYNEPYTITSKELSEFLEQNAHLQATTKATSGDSYTTIYQKDLYTPKQKEMYIMYPNYESNLASVRTKGYDQLVIISAKKD